MLDYFVIDNNQYALRLDASEFTQPMTHYVEHPIEIDFHFNGIAYNKGMCGTHTLCVIFIFFVWFL